MDICFYFQVAGTDTGFFFRGGGGQGKNITHFTINKIMQIFNIF
jgi:hypothetical protein